ncbi:Camelysin metallo-endopeptidase [Geodermatophilus siccatus]|uniref:Camelysin metallo-endopeptidase n=1 Tax=Geodermatophilus siccatus TaxID=1137991 RepID=A0A1G9Q2A6_9ACTN|nr:TasA family protein [Geodermatophilus siccatus]SDM04475.1 Camelysin metallo-endopeptidase [Geodermatophilus siccatus]
MSSSNRAGTTRKVLGSLAVIGTAAAVAGLGTFGTFTDSTTPVSAQLTSGTVSIDLAQPAAPVPAVTTGLLPGDSIARTLTLVNDGDSPLSSVALGVSTTNPGVLTNDPVNGLQLTLEACSVAWTQAGTAPLYTCAGTERAITTGGAAIGNRTLEAPASLTPGGTDHLLLTLSLPTTADDTFQGKTSTLALTFSGVQRAATTR